MKRKNIIYNQLPKGGLTPPPPDSTGPTSDQEDAPNDEESAES